MKESLYLSEELAARARTESISESEIAEVVTSCRTENALVFDPQTDAYTCCAPLGKIMLWVRFHTESDARRRHFGIVPESKGSCGVHGTESDARRRHAGIVPESKDSCGVHSTESDARRGTCEGIVIEDWYFNRTTVITVQGRPPSKGAKLSPLLLPWVERGLRCVRCDRTLEPRIAEFRYLEQRYRSVLLACPECALVFEPRELIEHQREQIERLLENK